jgi:hypothetical protein
MRDVGGVMDVLGNERDRDAGRDDDCGEAGAQPQRDTAGPLRADEHDRGRGYGGGIATGKGQVSVSKPPDKGLRITSLIMMAVSERVAEQEHHARPTRGKGGCAG